MYLTIVAQMCSPSHEPLVINSSLELWREETLRYGEATAVIAGLAVLPPGTYGGKIKPPRLIIGVIADTRLQSESRTVGTNS